MSVTQLDARRGHKAIGGGPPYDGDMEPRVAKLEAIIPTLATKEDLVKLRGETREGFESTRGEIRTSAEAARGDTRTSIEAVRGEIRASVESVRTEMHKNTAEIIKWVVGTAVVISVAAITIITFVLNNATPKAPAAAPQPVIIVPQGYEVGNAKPAPAPTKP